MCRLIIYYPVSALVTLFANILQNPQDSRARSDLKLMNLVVSFLGLLCTGEENGSVRRMLSVCAEFERIVKIVLDKADKENSSRRKRKQQNDEHEAAIEATAQQILSPEYQAARQAQAHASRNGQANQQQQTAPQTPVPLNMQDGFTPDFTGNFGDPVSKFDMYIQHLKVPRVRVLALNPSRIHRSSPSGS